MKNILLISPGPFSETDNDGQTLEDIFRTWDHTKIFQFYTQDIKPDLKYSQNYYCVSDFGALAYLLHRKYVTCRVSEVDDQVSTRKERKIKKTPLTMLLRWCLWAISPWKRKGFYSWIDECKPDLIFFEIGDNAYLMNTVADLKQKLNIPLVVHNTEGFYFFKHNYLNKGIVSDLFYPLMRSILVKKYRKVMKATDYIFYSCEKLLHDFSQEFKINSSVIYKSGNSRAFSPLVHHDPLKISYLGNLNFHRVDALLEIADFLSESYPKYAIDVYGGCRSEGDRIRLQEHSNINYHGFVSHEEVVQVNEISDVLLHVESELSLKEVIYGFSTKISDSLSSGNCFFLYAPAEVACAEYMHEHIPELVASSSEELKDKFSKILSDAQYRYGLVEKCLDLAAENHDAARISDQFKTVIDNVHI